ncbi:hypothetical protein [Selenomonas sp. AB3002]|uniref:hypothetical protein n=1 Tax=Selenomonas sp. AB3002 TaxID=1392502 RepID=UPI000495B886
MKKKVTALLAGLMLTASAFCVASVSSDSIAIDGVAPGSTVESARAKLGTPDAVAGDKIYFPNGIVIDVADHNPNLVEEIETNSAGATPGGVTVGMSEAVLSDVYGRADKVDRDYDDTEYVYYSSDYSKKMEFKVVNGTIVKIKCELRD